MEKIEWLADFMKCSVQVAYTLIRTEEIPPVCVKRLNRRLRVNRELVKAWSFGKLDEALGKQEEPQKEAS